MAKVGQGFNVDGKTEHNKANINNTILRAVSVRSGGGLGEFGGPRGGPRSVVGDQSRAQGSLKMSDRFLLGAPGS